MAEPSFWQYGDDYWRGKFGAGAAPAASGSAPTAESLRAGTQARTAAAQAAIRAQRVAQFGESAVLAQEANTARGAVSPVAPQAAAAPATPRAGGIGAKASGVGRALGKGFLAAAPIAGAVMSAVDPQEKVAGIASDLGMDYDKAGGRIGSNIMNWLQNTGNAATLGAAGAIGRGISGVVGGLRDVSEGGSFFTPYTPGAAPTPAPARTAAPGVLDPTMNVGTAVPPAVGAVTPPAVQATAPLVPFTRADIQGSRVPTPGTGATMRTAPGGDMPIPMTEDGPVVGPFAQSNARVALYGKGDSVTNLDTREIGLGAAPAKDYGRMGNFFGAALNQKQAATTQAQQTAAAKMQYEFLSKLPGATKDQAEADALRSRKVLADAYLEQNPGDYAGASAILAGRGSSERFTPIPSLNPSDKTIIMADTRRGTATQVTPKVQVSIGRGTDGKYYRLDASGRAIAEATPAEITAVRPAGRGAVGASQSGGFVSEETGAEMGRKWAAMTPAQQAVWQAGAPARAAAIRRQLEAMTPDELAAARSSR